MSRVLVELVGPLSQNEMRVCAGHYPAFGLHCTLRTIHSRSPYQFAFATERRRIVAVELSMGITESETYSSKNIFAFFIHWLDGKSTHQHQTSNKCIASTVDQIGWSFINRMNRISYTYKPEISISKFIVYMGNGEIPNTTLNY